MAIRTPAHPDGYGPPPVSPLYIEFRDNVWGKDENGEPVLEAVWMTTLTIPYDNTTKALQDPITTHRDPACKWATFVVGSGTGAVDIPIAPGGATIAVVDLGVTTLADLETAGWTAIE